MLLVEFRKRRRIPRDWTVAMNRPTERESPETPPGSPSDLTKAQYDAALVRAREFLRTSRVLAERARSAGEVATARIVSAERKLRIAGQVLARLEMLGRSFETN
jgi:hypothetical protein